MTLGLNFVLIVNSLSPHNMIYEVGHTDLKMSFTIIIVQF